MTPLLIMLLFAVAALAIDKWRTTITQRDTDEQLAYMVSFARDANAIVNASSDAMGLDLAMSLPQAIRNVRAERDALQAALSTLISVIEDILRAGVDDREGTPGYSTAFALEMLRIAVREAKVTHESRSP